LKVKKKRASFCSLGCSDIKPASHLVARGIHDVGLHHRAVRHDDLAVEVEKAPCAAEGGVVDAL
jgi:hypothetical protein